MSERMILSVQNNKEKQQTYRKLLSKYDRAVEHEFYCEAIMISYAMIEDRLRSMIYHMGFIADRTKTVIWKNARPYLQQIVDDYKNEKEDDSLSLTSLSGKVKIIRSVCLWASNTEDGYRDTTHLTVLKGQLEGIDLANTVQVLDEVDRWRRYRNEVVHAMMNKNIFCLEESLLPCAEEGIRLARELDSIIKVFKTRNRVRKRIDLPIE